MWSEAVHVPPRSRGRRACIPRLGAQPPRVRRAAHAARAACAPTHRCHVPGLASIHERPAVRHSPRGYPLPRRAGQSIQASETLPTCERPRVGLEDTAGLASGFFVGRLLECESELPEPPATIELSPFLRRPAHVISLGRCSGCAGRCSLDDLSRARCAQGVHHRGRTPGRRDGADGRREALGRRGPGPSLLRAADAGWQRTPRVLRLPPGDIPNGWINLPGDTPA